MAKARYPQSFGKPRRILAEAPISETEIVSLLADCVNGLTLEVVSPGIEAGYLFHIKITDEGYVLLSYRGDSLTNFARVESLIQFINHVSGLRFDEGSWRISDNLNRRREVE